jgi:hypothetical protein
MIKKIDTKKIKKSEANPLIHDEKGRFYPGHTGIGGRPPGSKNFTTKVKDALMKIADGTNTSYEELLIKRILNRAISDGNIPLIIHMWEQIDGKPTQKHELVAQVANTKLERKKAADIVRRFEIELKQELLSNNDK